MNDSFIPYNIQSWQYILLSSHFSPSSCLQSFWYVRHAEGYVHHSCRLQSGAHLVRSSQHLAAGCLRASLHADPLELSDWGEARPHPSHLPGAGVAVVLQGGGSVRHPSIGFSGGEWWCVAYSSCQRSPLRSAGGVLACWLLRLQEEGRGGVLVCHGRTPSQPVQ